VEIEGIVGGHHDVEVAVPAGVGEGSRAPRLQVSADEQGRRYRQREKSPEQKVAIGEAAADAGGERAKRGSTPGGEGIRGLLVLMQREDVRTSRAPTRNYGDLAGSGGRLLV
jgi:hypothetical protein